MHEAEVLDSAFKFYGRNNVSIIFLNVSEEWAKERLMGRQRGDDKKDEINRRLGWYKTEVLPVVDFFKKHKIYRFIDIKGEQPIEKVHSDIVANLKL